MVTANQDRAEAEERFAEVRRQAAAGKGIDEILADEQAERTRKILERALRLDEEDNR